MTAADLPARFTIEQRSDPLGLHRYLSTSDTGGKFWGHPCACNVFGTEEGAESYRECRMGVHALDAVVVRHTVH